MRVWWLLVAASLAQATAARAEKVTLSNGDVLDGKILEKTDDKVVLEHAVLGRLEIPTDKLSIATTKAGMFGSGFLRGWDRRLEVGLNGSDGNSDTLNVLGGLHLGFKDDHHRFKLDGVYRLSRQDGDDTEHNAFAQGVHDWIAPDRRWFPFVDARWDFDEFEDWDHRIASHAGLGYALFETERFELIVRGGLGAYRTFGAEDDRWVPEALAGGEGIWRIASGHELSFYSWLYPDLDDTGEYRNLSGAAWKIGLTQEVSLKLSVENEYESLVEADTEHNDLRYTGSILIGF
jgi:putative salt-induced outer membrane protein YdiY